MTERTPAGDNSSDLREQLWDLVYGLLDEQEAEALELRINSDPAAARAYADVCLESEELAMVARVEEPRLSLQWESAEPAAPPAKPAPAARPPAPPRGATASASPLNRGLAAAVAVAALMLLTVTLYPVFRPAPDRASTALLQQAPQITVSGPREAHPRGETPFLVEVRSLDDQVLSDYPLQYSVRAEGQKERLSEIRTDKQGRAMVRIDGRDLSGRARLGVRGGQQSVELSFQTMDEAAVSSRALSRRRVDEMRRFDSRHNNALLANSMAEAGGLSQGVEQEMAPRDAIQPTEPRRALNVPADSPVAGAAPNAPAAPNTPAAPGAAAPAPKPPSAPEEPAPERADPAPLVAPIDGSPKLQGGPFATPEVKTSPAQQLAIRNKAVFYRERFAQDVPVVADLIAADANGRMLAKRRVLVEAKDDNDDTTFRLLAETDEQGELHFSAPPIANRRHRTVELRLADARRTLLSRSEIPQAEAPQVEMQATGGKLVPGVPATIDFQVKGAQGSQVTGAGQLLNSRGVVLARTAQSEGKLRLVPAAGERYLMRWATADGLEAEAEILAELVGPPPTLDARLGELSDQSLEIDLAEANIQGLEGDLRVVVRDLGVIVGQQKTQLDEETKKLQVALQQAPQGQLRVSFYSDTGKLIDERLLRGEQLESAKTAVEIANEPLAVVSNRGAAQESFESLLRQQFDADQQIRRRAGYLGLGAAAAMMAVALMLGALRIGSWRIWTPALMVVALCGVLCLQNVRQETRAGPSVAQGPRQGEEQRGQKPRGNKSESQQQGQGKPDRESDRERADSDVTDNDGQQRGRREAGNDSNADRFQFENNRPNQNRGMEGIRAAGSGGAGTKDAAKNFGGDDQVDRGQAMRGGSREARAGFSGASGRPTDGKPATAKAVANSNNSNNSKGVRGSDPKGAARKIAGGQLGASGGRQNREFDKLNGDELWLADASIQLGKPITVPTRIVSPGELAQAELQLLMERSALDLAEPLARQLPDLNGKSLELVERDMLAGQVLRRAVKKRQPAPSQARSAASPQADAAEGESLDGPLRPGIYLYDSDRQSAGQADAADDKAGQDRHPRYEQIVVVPEGYQQSRQRLYLTRRDWRQEAPEGAQVIDEEVVVYPTRQAQLRDELRQRNRSLPLSLDELAELSEAAAAALEDQADSRNADAQFAAEAKLTLRQSVDRMGQHQNMDGGYGWLPGMATEADMSIRSWQALSRISPRWGVGADQLALLGTQRAESYAALSLSTGDNARKALARREEMTSGQAEKSAELTSLGRASQGELQLLADGKVVTHAALPRGSGEPLTIGGLQSAGTAGTEWQLRSNVSGLAFRHKLKYVTPTPPAAELPMKLSASCPPQAQAGTPVTVQLQLHCQQPLQRVMVQVGLPAGLRVSPADLAPLREDGQFDAFTLGNQTVKLGWASLSAGQHQVQLPATAALAGRFTSRAAAAQSGDQRAFAAPLKIEITE